MSQSVAGLIASMRGGEVSALARLLSLAENDRVALGEIMRSLPAAGDGSYCIGVTGPPGAGKSTLVSGLIARIREEGLTVGVIAVDPTSPVSGGAVLGDRVRMQRHYLDKGVFIRSMASRGSRGGLPAIVDAAVRLLSASGKDIIIIETVGVGQIETDIARVADVIVVVLAPESGDEVQALKAGLVELADIIVINKADRGGAEALAAEFEAAFRGPGRKPVPAVITAQAINNIGIDLLYREMDKRRGSC